MNTYLIVLMFFEPQKFQMFHLDMLNWYISSNIVHPWNAFWLTIGSSVPKYIMHSRLEQFKNENSYIFEILDKIIIDFNFEHPSNRWNFF